MRLLRSAFSTVALVAGFASIAVAALTAATLPPSATRVVVALTVLAAAGWPFSLPWPGLPAVALSRIIVYCSLIQYGWAPFALLTTLEALLRQEPPGRGCRVVFWRRPTPKPLAWVVRRPLAAVLAGLAFQQCTALSGSEPVWPRLALAVLTTVAVQTCALGFLDTLDHPARRRRLRSTIQEGSVELCAAAIAVGCHWSLTESALPALGIGLASAAAIIRLKQAHGCRERDLLLQVEKNQDLYQATLQTMALAVDARDQIDQGHLFRVQAIALDLAHRVGVQNDNDLGGLAIAALLHDIGKLATPEYILSKNGSLTPMEMDTVEAHAEVGADILSLVPFPFPVQPFVRHHHEKWDGSGYPDGLRKEEIPLGARILSIADCYDSMRANRPYRPSLSRQTTLRHIRAESGKSFDPSLAELLIKHADEIDEKALQASQESLLFESGLRRSASPSATPRSSVFQSIVSAHQEMQAIQEVSGVAANLMSTSEALSFLAGKIQSLVRNSSCAIFMGAPGEALSCRFASGLFCEELQGIVLEPGCGVTGWVALHRRPAINVSPSQDLHDTQTAVASFQSCLSVPLLSEPGMTAVVTLYSLDDNAFRPRDVRMVSKLAQFAGIAVRNAVLFEDTKKHAYEDPLTGLPNLRYFKNFAEQELRRAERLNYPVTLVMMDLDRFKEINDHHGHSSGDQVLVHMARLLKCEMRRSDTCIRYGGDEFIGVMPGADRNSAQAIVAKIQTAAASQPIRLSRGDWARIGVSIGVATFPDDSRDLHQLLNLADERMYRDKFSRTVSRPHPQVPRLAST